MEIPSEENAEIWVEANRGSADGWFSFFRRHTTTPRTITPGQRFRQPDQSLWKVARLVTFRVDPLPHVELIKAHPIREGVAERKIISLAALHDPKLFRFDGAGAP
jgi:hypothetical protein